jgi:hypothetical protein
MDQAGVHLPKDSPAQVQFHLSIHHIVMMVSRDDEDGIDILTEVAYAIAVGTLRRGVIDENVVRCFPKIDHHGLKSSKTTARPGKELILLGKPIGLCELHEITPCVK